MLTIIFFIAVIWVVAKLFVLGIKMAWGFAKFVCAILVFPVFLAGLLLMGMVYIAIPVLLIGGLIAVIGNLITA